MNIYTPAQAAAVTGLPLKSVQKAIDSRSVPFRIIRRRGIGKRYLVEASLICLRLEAEGLRQLPLEFRRQVYRTVARTPHERQIRFSDVVLVDVAKARKGLAIGLNELRKAERMIISNPEIMGGTPVFRGTRVPVYAIAGLVRGGTPVEEILEGYPSLTEEKIRLAELYVTAHPKRGRPPAQPWAGTRPVRRTRKRLNRAA